MNINNRFDLELIKKHNEVKQYQYLCERNALIVALWGYGIPTPILLMSAGLYLQDTDFHNKGSFTTNFSRCSLNKNLSNLLSKTQYKLDWQIIDENLIKNRLVLINVDVFYLPYKHNTYYQKSHGSHIIILFNKTKNGYMIVDWYDPDYFIGEVSQDQLTLARESTNERSILGAFSGYSINSAYKIFDINYFPSKINLKEMTYMNIFESTDFMLKKNCGINFIDNIIKSKPLWIDKVNQQEYESSIKSLFFFDLELEYLLEYYRALEGTDELNRFHIYDLLNSTKELQLNVKKIKNILLIAYKKKTPINAEQWIECANLLKQTTSIYLKNAIFMLSTLKSSL